MYICEVKANRSRTIQGQRQFLNCFRWFEIAVALSISILFTVIIIVSALWFYTSWRKNNIKNIIQFKKLKIQ